MSTTSHRRKLSTTVSEETHTFLQTLVETGKAASIAEAVDIAVLPARRAENRARLERDTSAYFQRLAARAAKAEGQLERALGHMVDEVDFED